MTWDCIISPFSQLINMFAEASTIFLDLFRREEDWLLTLYFGQLLDK